MKLIADCGSTKTSWILFNQEIKKEFETSGANPIFTPEKDFLTTLENLHDYKEQVKELYFYGAGCANPKLTAKIETPLKQFFNNSKVEVQSDLLAAARAVSPNKESIVAILGTGMNSCFFDGEKICSSIPPLGYIIGDEGSGAYLGKKLVKYYMRNRTMPNHLRKSFEQEYRVNYEILLNKVYQESYPNKFLASLSKFLYEHKADAFVQDLLLKSFNKFFKNIISLYKQPNELNIVGSIGFYFEEEIREIANNYEYRINKIIKQPIEELYHFHNNKGVSEKSINL